MIAICPCCRRPMEGARAPIGSLSSTALGPMERRIVEALVRVYPRRITNEHLADILYGNESDGGPENARGTISVIMIRLRKKLPAFGWTIGKARPGPGTEGYHLEPTEPIA